MDITAVGGYNEFGRNMTVVSFGNDSIIIDMGIRLDRVMVHEDTDMRDMSNGEMVQKGIIPDVSSVKGKVRAIVLSHGHLDHIGAVPKLAARYNAPVIGAPYTIELLKSEKKFDKKFTFNNFQVLNSGETIEVTPQISIEFVHVTHSIPHASLVAVHGPDGTLLYANDFKFDDFPGIGQKPDYKRLKELGKEGVKCMIVESTRVAEERRTASEKVVKTMLLDNLIKANTEKGLVLTTFSSHISRINAITQIAQLMDRKPVLLGRSMGKYSGIAEKLGIIKLPKNVETYVNPRAVKKTFKKIADEGKEKYMLIVTGHQGEPDAMLQRMANKSFDYTFDKGDQVIFSADVIPNPMNVANRYALETKLRIQGAHLIKDVHVSGHASREDHRDLLGMINPENIIPCHGDLQMQSSYAELAEDSGYEFNKNLFLVRNGQRAKL